jgi:glycosyltransferase involved in cell wall biosynthesis
VADRIAYVTARFPPMQTSGTYRVEAVLHYLPGHGFEIAPVTIPNAWMEQQAGRALPPIGDPAVNQPQSRLDPMVRTLASVPLVRKALRAALIPDVLAPWARSVGPALLNSMGGVGLVYATSPPFSAMILAQELARALGVPCVQEIRDPPSFNRRLRGRGKAWIRRMFEFERTYLIDADAVITVTEGTRVRLLELHPDLSPERCFVVTNGYPEIEPDPSLSGRDPRSFTITYVGSFQGGTKGREDSMFNPATVLPALSSLPTGRTRLRIVGPVTPAQRRAIEESRGGDRVEFVGVVDREHAVAELAASDVALILAENDEWWIGRKVFEAIAFAPRILALVPTEGDASRLLRAHGKATIVGPDEAAHIVGIVARLYNEWASTPSSAPGRDPVDIQTDRSCVEQIAHVLRVTLQQSSGQPEGLDRPGL